MNLIGIGLNLDEKDYTCRGTNMLATAASKILVVYIILARIPGLVDTEDTVHEIINNNVPYIMRSAGKGTKLWKKFFFEVFWIKFTSKNFLMKLSIWSLFQHFPYLNAYGAIFDRSKFLLDHC